MITTVLWHASLVIISLQACSDIRHVFITSLLMMSLNEQVYICGLSERTILNKRCMGGFFSHFWYCLVYLKLPIFICILLLEQSGSENILWIALSYVEQQSSDKSEMARCYVLFIFSSTFGHFLKTKADNFYKSHDINKPYAKWISKMSDSDCNTRITSSHLFITYVNFSLHWLNYFFRMVLVFTAWHQGHALFLTFVMSLSSFKSKI